MAASNWKTWAGRFALIVLPPLLLLGSFELACRAFAWGYPTSFLVPDQIGEREVWRTNEFYGYRFFQPLMARSPAPIVINRDKPPGAKRVAVFGESAAMGDPLIEFSLARALDKILNAPGKPRRYEVINAAMTAISSPVVLDIAEELAGKGVDIFVVYTGNNEVVGPYGPGTVFQQGTAGRWFAPWHVRWTRTRLASAVRAWQSSASPGKPWDGMAMFAENRLSPDDPQIESVHANFGQNLERIVGVAQQQGIETILCTMAVNLRDCPPFGSAHGRVLDEEDATAWQVSFQSGRSALDAGRAIEAKEALTEALRLDPDHAELNYLIAVAMEKSGDTGEAEHFYARARDLDTLRVRTDSKMNDSIRAVAACRGAKLIESEEIFGAAPGAESFVDHVHFTLEGVGLLANAVAAAIEESPQVPNTDALAERVDYNDWSTSKLATIMLQRLGHPPFRDQSGNAGRIAYWQTERQYSAAAVSTADAEEILDQLATRQSQYPWDEEYALQSLHRLAGINAWPEAATLADRLRPRLRGSSAVNGLLALVYAKVGRPEDAAATIVGNGPPHGFFLIDATLQLLAALTAMDDAGTARTVADQILERAPDFPGRPVLLRWRTETGAGS